MERIGDRIPEVVRYHLLLERIQRERPFDFQQRWNDRPLSLDECQNDLDSGSPIFRVDFERVESERTNPNWSSLPVVSDHSEEISHRIEAQLCWRQKRQWATPHENIIIEGEALITVEPSTDTCCKDHPHGYRTVRRITLRDSDRTVEKQLLHEDDGPFAYLDWKDVFPELTLREVLHR